jgi:hypothetical protein
MDASPFRATHKCTTGLEMFQASKEAGQQAALQLMEYCDERDAIRNLIKR